MQDILNVIINTWNWILQFYNSCIKYGVNPLSIILIVLLTAMLKNNFKFYTGKYKKVKIMITAFVFGILFSLFFLWLNNNFTLKLLILNIIINTVASGYSDSIFKMIKEIKESKKK